MASMLQAPSSLPHRDSYLRRTSVPRVWAPSRAVRAGVHTRRWQRRRERVRHPVLVVRRGGPARAVRVVRRGRRGRRERRRVRAAAIQPSGPGRRWIDALHLRGSRSRGVARSRVRGAIAEVQRRECEEDQGYETADDATRDRAHVTLLLRDGRGGRGACVIGVGSGGSGGEGARRVLPGGCGHGRERC
jgi:hypothetical protein